MSERLLRLAANFEIDNRIVSWDELISSDTILSELGHQLTRFGWPERTFEEISKELVRLHGRWEKRGKYMKYGADRPYLWMSDSEDEDDAFMPSTKTTSTSKGKDKTTSSSKGKDKSTSSSKGKEKTSSSSKKKNQVMHHQSHMIVMMTLCQTSTGIYRGKK